MKTGKGISGGRPGKDKLVKRVRDKAPVLAGALTSGFVHGPLGPALGISVATVCAEVLDRLLSERQEARAILVLEAAATRMKQLEAEGQQLRDDDFFREVTDRHDFEEVAEQVLMSAMNDSQEKKAPLYGALLAHIAFQPQIDRDSAHHLVKLAQELSYRQLCLFALIGRKDRFTLPNERRGGPLKPETWSAFDEFDRIGYAQLELVLAPPDAPGLLPTNLNAPASSMLSTKGRLLHDLMDLETIPDEELRSLAEVLNA